MSLHVSSALCPDYVFVTVLAHCHYFVERSWKVVENTQIELHGKNGYDRIRVQERTEEADFRRA